MKGKPVVEGFSRLTMIMGARVVRLVLISGFLLLSFGPPVWGQESAGPNQEANNQEDMAAIAEKINNPLSNLWLLFTQSDFTWWDGTITDKKRLVNVTLFQPVMPMALTENWRMILRPVLPVASFPFSGFDYETGPKGPIPVPNFGRHSGLGDAVLWTAFSNAYTPPNIFGFGPTMMFPTATYRTLGTGKFNMGPMVLAFHTGRKWIIGTVAQHWWTVTGDRQRGHVNLTDLQYIVRYRVTTTTNVGFGPNIRINWAADGRDRVTFPVGFGGDTMIKLGPLPMRVGAEFHYYPITPEVAGPQYNLRVFFVPVIPAPEWSKRPLF